MLWIHRSSIIVLSFLLGCGVVSGDHKNTQTNNFARTPGTTADAVPAAPLPVSIPSVSAPQAGSTSSPQAPAAMFSAPVQPRTETTASNNAVEQSLTGFGVQLGKLAERVEGIHSEITSSVQTSAAATLKAVADLKLSIEPKAAVQGAAGVGNSIASNQSTVTAGRDSTQFTDSMANMIIEQERAHSKTLCAVVASLCAVITAFVEASRRRADRRHKEAEAKLERKSMPVPTNKEAV